MPTAGSTDFGVPASGIRDQVLLAAWTHPDVPGPELALIACFGVWVDAVRHHLRRHRQAATAERYAAKLRANLAGPPGGSVPRDAADPVERGLCDLRARVAPSWRWQLDTALIDLLRGQPAESAGSVVSRVPNPIDHLELGRGPGPGPWAAQLVAYGLRTTLPAEVTGGAAFRAVHNAFCDVVLLRSPWDPASEDAERSGSVVVLQRHFGQSRPLAMAMLGDLQARRSQRFDELTSAELPALLAACRDEAQRETVLRYVQGLRDWLAGMLAWRPNAAEAEVEAATRPAPARQRTANRVRLPDFFMPFDTHPNPRLEAARRHTRAWARQHGLLDGGAPEPAMRQWTPSGFDAADYALLAALTEPDADEAELGLAADRQVWSWRADDHLIASGGGAEFLSRLPQLLRPDSRAAGASWERALTDVWRRTTADLGSRPRREIAVRLAEMLELRAAELGAAETADPLELLASRRRTCGGELTAALLRHRHAPGIPAELFATVPMRTMATTFAEVGALRHDLFRYRAGPAEAHPVPDVVTAIAAFLCCGPHQAVAIADDMCTARLRRFESIAHREIPVLVEEFELTAAAGARLERYVRGLQQWTAGELRWISVTGRYAGTGDRPRRARRALGRPGFPRQRFLRRTPG
ncbi:terpene synthase family protein [Saccharopolyspora sp. NPDC002578]